MKYISNYTEADRMVRFIPKNGIVRFVTGVKEIEI